MTEKLLDLLRHIELRVENNKDFLAGSLLREDRLHVDVILKSLSRL